MTQSSVSVGGWDFAEPGKSSTKRHGQLSMDCFENRALKPMDSIKFAGLSDPQISNQASCHTTLTKTNLLSNPPFSSSRSRDGDLSPQNTKFSVSAELWDVRQRAKPFSYLD